PGGRRRTLHQRQADAETNGVGGDPLWPGRVRWRAGREVGLDVPLVEEGRDVIQVLVAAAGAAAGDVHVLDRLRHAAVLGRLTIADQDDRRDLASEADGPVLGVHRRRLERVVAPVVAGAEPRRELVVLNEGAGDVEERLGQRRVAVERDGVDLLDQRLA